MFFNAQTNGGYLANRLRTLNRINKTNKITEKTLPPPKKPKLTEPGPSEELTLEVDENVIFLKEADPKTQEQTIKLKMLDTFHFRKFKKDNVLELFPRFIDRYIWIG